MAARYQEIGTVALPIKELALGDPRPELDLGTALLTLGERESGTARLEEAIVAYHDALMDRTRDRVPLKWAVTEASLGIGTALLILSERGSGTARLEEAIAAYRDALMERTRDHVPLDWATSFGNQGVAMILLAERTKNKMIAETACQQIEAALETLRSGGYASGAAYYESGLPGGPAGARRSVSSLSLRLI